MTEFSETLAARGITVQFIQKNLLVHARLVAAIDPDQRQAVFDQFLKDLAAVGVLTQADVTGLDAFAQARRNGAVASSPPSGGLSGFPAVTDLLRQSLVAPATDSVLDDLFTGICTALGGLVGEALGGPGGAAIGAYLMHQWAEENPPSLW
jgi:hypothetical protein